MFAVLRAARRVHWLVAAAALVLPGAAFAQVQVNQNFNTQGPAPSFGDAATVQSRDAPPNGNVSGAIGPVIADPLNANRFFIGTPGGGIWTTSNGGATWTPLTDKQATLSIASLAFDPTDVGVQTGNLLVQTNDPSYDEVKVPWSGIGQ